MKYLLDVNVLVAWGWMDHSDHARVATWIAKLKATPGTVLLTSAIPQLGFVRVSVQRTAGQVTPGEAGEVLRGMTDSLGPIHEFLPDNRTATPWPEWCRAAAQTTDAHLTALAKAHGARLATLDTAIPGAFILPRVVDAGKTGTRSDGWQPT